MAAKQSTPCLVADFPRHLKVENARSHFAHHSFLDIETSSGYGNRTHLPSRCARRLHAENKAKSFRQDPYILAHRYRDCMKDHPIRKSYGNKHCFNEYCQNLLANQLEPDLNATDDRSRTIRYAEEHFECYEIRDIARMFGWLNEAKEKENHADLTTLLERIRSPSHSPSQSSHETSRMTAHPARSSVLDATRSWIRV